LLFSLVGTRVAGAFAMLLAQLVLARTLPTDDVGYFFLALSLTSLFGLLLTMGYPAIAITYLSRYRALGSTRLPAALRKAARIDMMRVALLAFPVILAILVFAPFSTGVKTAIFVGGVGAPAVAAIRMNGAIANAARRFQLSFIPDFLLRPLCLLAYLAALYAFLGEITLPWVLAGFLAIAYAIGAAQSWLLGPQSIAARIEPGFTRLKLSVWRTRAGLFLIVALVTVTFADVVIFVSGLFLEAAEVAVLGVAIKLVVLVGFVTQATQQFILSDLTAALMAGKSREANTLLLQANLVSVGVTGTAVLGCMLAGDHVLGVFGTEYAAGQSLLAVLIVSQLLRAGGSMNMHLLAIEGNQAAVAKIGLVSMTALVLVSALLAEPVGALGIAIGVVVSDMLWVVLLAVAAQRLAGRRGDLLALLISPSPRPMRRDARYRTERH